MIRLLSAAGLAAGALAGIGQGTAAASTCVSWTGSQPANPSSSGDLLTGVSVDSPCDVWAVGFKQVGVITQTLTEHWNGLSWTPMPSSSPGGSSNDSNFAAVAVKSPTDGWAVGHYSNGTANQTLVELLRAVGTYIPGLTAHTLIAHWNGTAWSRVTSPSPRPASYSAWPRHRRRTPGPWAPSAIQRTTRRP